MSELIFTYARAELLVCTTEITSLNLLSCPLQLPSFRFQDDNARAHRAHVVLNHLQTCGIQSLPWPAMSPDLSPIEHVWDILGRRVQGHVQAPRNLQELANVLQEQWRRIPQNDIRRLVGSMRRRCVACLAANGGPTRY